MVARSPIARRPSQSASGLDPPYGSAPDIATKSPKECETIKASDHGRDEGDGSILAPSLRFSRLAPFYLCFRLGVGWRQLLDVKLAGQARIARERFADADAVDTFHQARAELAAVTEERLVEPEARDPRPDGATMRGAKVSVGRAEAAAWEADHPQVNRS